MSLNLYVVYQAGKGGCMKEFGIFMFVLALFWVVLGPFMEIFHLFTEKARIDAAIQAAGRAAVINSVKLRDASEVNAKIDLQSFIDNYNIVFSESLGLVATEKEANSTHFEPSAYNINYNAFDVSFEILGEETCKIIVSTAHKYKSPHFKYVESKIPNFTSFNIVRERRQVLNLNN